MENVKNCKEQILLINEKILQEMEYLKEQYNTFFIIEKVFSSENGGKTRLNRQIFNEKHEEIINKILIMESFLDEALTHVRNTIKDMLAQNNEFNKIDLINFIFDDANFLEILEMDLGNHVISRDSKKDLILNIKELLQYKNRIFNYKYYLEMINTSVLEKYINRLGVEDLINSTIIFEIIDSYSLQYEELLKFENELKDFDGHNSKINSFQFLNSILELHKRRTDNYIYANVRYKIFIEYNNDIDIKPLSRNISYLENIISCFIDQSCTDLVKKELKKGKIQKNIELNIIKNKKDLQIIVKNNGFEIKNIYNLFLSDVDNKYILEAKNLTSLIDGKLEIFSSDEGVTYILTL